MDVWERSALRPAEVAELLGLSTATVYYFIERGVLPSIKIGKRVRVPTAELRQWIADQSKGVASDAAA